MVKLFPASDIDDAIRDIIAKLGLDHLKPDQIIAFRSTGSTARIRARIYAMPRIWQLALKQKPHYCIEFLSEHFDHLSIDDKLRVVIHELLHIPKTFSGALLPHLGSGRRHQVTHITVEKIFKLYKQSKSS